MEREKERQRQQWEEKESNEAEEDGKRAEDADDEEEQEEDLENAVLVWQEDYGKDNLGLPIMHWEALSLHIAELEKQEEQKKAKSGASLERGRPQVSWTEERRRRAESWDDGEDNCNTHMIALSSRLQTQMNLQLCFINNSESEDDEKEGDILVKENAGNWSKRASVQVHKNPQPAAKPEKPKSGGLRNTLRNLRDRLRADHKSQATACSDRVIQRRHLERSDLNNLTIKELNSLSTSLSQTIQDLSSELVGRLQVRDQLRTKQDALLLEVQDLTSV